MSNGDDAAESEPAEGDSDTKNEMQDTEIEPGVFERRLDDAAETLDAAETEGDLDAVEATVDDIESDLDDATLVTDTAAETDDDDESPRTDLEDRIGELRDGIEEQRGPYAEDVASVLDDAEQTITTSEWAREGLTEVTAAVGTFLGTADTHLDASLRLDVGAEDGEQPDANKTERADDLASAVSDAAEAVTDAGLDPDEDAERIDTLLDAAETLTETLDDALVFGDLEIREQLDRMGFYDVLDPENRKDFPPEWNAIKLYEQRGEVEPILTALDKLDSDFMQDNVLDAFEHIAPEAAYDAVHSLAQRRNEQPVRVLGRIGDERACDTLHDFLGGGDISLEKTTLWALGAIGSHESTEPVAQRLVADSAEVRSAAARALGRIGDTRAIDPLEKRLAEDDADTVRASAAWALNQIGTERALDAVAGYEDDRSYLVQVEAERATV